MTDPRYLFLVEQSKKIMLVRSATSFLSWDQATYLPPKGAAYRAEQMGYLSTHAHALATDKKFVDTVYELAEIPGFSGDEATNISETKRLLEDIISVPAEFVHELSITISHANDAWRKAREENRFEIFAPLLEKIVALKKEEIRFRRRPEDQHIYSVLLRSFEPGISVDELDGLFSRLKTGITGLMNTLNLPGSYPKSAFEIQDPEQAFRAFSEKIMEDMGFDFQAGRVDTTIHPFCMGLHPTDVRVTYRHKEGDMAFLLWGLIHETGHGLYEQGLRPDQYGLPMGTYASLSVHESQSRFWENNISRGKAFWEYAAPLAKQYIPGLKNANPEQLFRDANRIFPNLIRIDADELNYHLHIIIRYEIEKALMEGNISVNDLPQEWNKRYQSYIGLTPASDREGVLQDVHWSHGMFGYFPTYTIGSLMASQLWAVVQSEIPDLEAQIRSGNLQILKNWLNEHVYQYGMKFQAQELCKRISGVPLNEKYFLDYAKDKFQQLYS